MGDIDTMEAGDTVVTMALIMVGIATTRGMGDTTEDTDIGTDTEG